MPRDMALLRAFDLIEGIGEEREDVRNAVLRHTIIASQIGSKKAPGVADLLPRYWALSADELRELMSGRLGMTEEGGDGG